MTGAINEEDLVVGRVYAVNTRNLVLATWNGRGFVGRRVKFDYSYITEEPGYAYDIGGMFMDSAGEVVRGGFEPEDITLLADEIRRTI